MKHFIKIFPWLMALSLMACSHHSEEDTQSKGATVSFSVLQASYLSAKCATCHSGTAPAGNLDFSSYRKIMDSGTVVASKSDESQFYLSMLNGRMPPGNPAPPDITRLIRQWIENGAGEFDPPVVQTISPSVGGSGAQNVLTFSGKNFAPDCTVKFGQGTFAVSVKYVSSESITVVAPAMPSQIYDVTVANPDGSTFVFKSGYRVSGSGGNSTLTVSRLFPASGRGGTILQVNGDGFLPGAAVDVGSQPCMATQVISANQIVCTIPPVTQSGEATVRVTNPDGASYPLINGFTYNVPASYTYLKDNVFAPKCGSCHGASSPAQGIMLTAYDKIMSSGTVVPYDPDSSLLYMAVLPSHSPQMPKNAAPLSNLDILTLYNWIYNGAYNDSPPTITSITPNQGSTAGGTVVVIAGTGFLKTQDAQPSVNLGNFACLFPTVNSAGTQIQCVTSPATAGTVSTIVINPSIAGMDQQPGIKAASYSYIPDPKITSISPNSGKSSSTTPVTITGTDFAASGVSFKFGAVATASVTPTCTNGVCTATVVPPVQAAGQVAVRVTNTVGGQFSDLANGYTFLAGDPPVVTSVNVGTLTFPVVYTGTAPNLTINGSGFLAGATVMIGGKNANNVVVVSSTKITCRPATNVIAGNQPVVVTNADGLTNANFSLLFRATLAITTLSPSSRPAGAGGVLTLSGAGFVDPVAVTVDGTPCSSVQFNAASEVVCLLPTNVVAKNSVLVVATNPADENGTVKTASNSGFTFTMVLSSVSPNAGPAGTSITIAGAGFSSASVTVGGVACNVTAQSLTSVTCTTGAGTAGAVDVVVTNGNGATKTLTGGFTNQ